MKLTDDLSTGRKLRVGMVGGGRGAYFAGIHRAAMRLTNRFEVVAGAFSSDPQNCADTAEALGIPPHRAHASATDMANAEGGLDVAVVVTPNFLHFDACRVMLQAGIPVICDKPLVTAVSEARELVTLAEETGLFFALTYTYTGYPMVRDARARIRAGEIGDVRMMHVEYLLEWLADDPAKLGKGGVWRGDPARSGPTGCVGDIGTHAFNVLEFVSGQRCRALNARLRTFVPGFTLDDTNMMMMEFDGGADAMLWCSLAAAGHRNSLKFKIVGTRGTLEWQQEAPETLRMSRLGQADLVFRRGQSDNTPDALAAASLPAGSPEAYIEALAVLYSNFADCLAAGRDWRSAVPVPVPDINEGLRGVVLSELCLQSSREERWLPFPA